MSDAVDAAVDLADTRVELKMSSRPGRLGRARRSLLMIAVQLGGILVGFIICAGIIAASGADPIAAYKAVFEGAFGSGYNIMETLVKATPLLLVGLGVAIAFRSSVWNIGGEGQLRMGALAAAALGIFAVGREIPGVILIPLMILAAFLAGGAWGGLAGWMKVRWRVNEVISTIMMNFIAILFVNFIVTGPLREPTGGGVALTKEIAPSGELPRLLAGIYPGSRLHLGFVIGLLLVVAVYVFFWHTIPGYQLRAVGANPKAARLGGINVAWSIILSLILSGGLAGIGGMVEVAGLHYRLIEGFSPNYGSSGMLVALLGKLHPVGVLLASILFGGLIIGTDAMTRAVEVPGSIVYVIQGVVVLCMLASEQLGRYLGLAE